MTEEQSLRSKLNAETAQIPWQNLAPFFARGQLLKVSGSLNLLDAAVAVAEDQASQIQQWQKSGLLVVAEDADAIAWQAKNTVLWAVVVRPFVLVQQPS